MYLYNRERSMETAIEKFPDMGRTLLQVYTGNGISENEAAKLLRRIADHKWYISEKLDRDVGFHVAAIDYVEHFYEPRTESGYTKIARFSAAVRKAIVSAAKAYLTAKGSTYPL